MQLWGSKKKHSDSVVTLLRAPRPKRGRGSAMPPVAGWLRGVAESGRHGERKRAGRGHYVDVPDVGTQEADGVAETARRVLAVLDAVAFDELEEEAFHVFF